MDGVLATWRGLEMRRRVILVAAAVATMVAVLALGQLATRPSMSLLYSGLDPATAGEVVGALEQLGEPYQIRGDAIFVDAGARDRVRLALARDGLPRQGQDGYELLDRMSGFSATAEMFDAAYWRAREGELARTILASPRVRSARVHIANPSRQGFRRDQRMPSATITVSMAGGAVSPDEATAFRYLVALSVPGLTPEQVAVIDTRAGLVLAPGSTDASAMISTLAAGREAHLKKEIETLLAARVGQGKARVSVSVEASRVAETVREKVIEPGSRVAVHTDTQEMTDTASGRDGAVTIASNLPEDEEDAGPDSESARNETRERVNYDYSEVRRERVRQPGEISRISVAVLVDGVTEIDASGQPQWTPRPQSELNALRQLVIAAIGYDEERGDLVTVESMAFQPVPEDGTLAEAGLAERLIEQNAASFLQLVVLAAVILVLALMVIRPILLKPTSDDAVLLVDGREETEDAEQLTAVEAAQEFDEHLLNLPDRETLRQAVAEYQDQSVATLRDWLEHEEAA